MHDPMDIFSESVIFIQWAFFSFSFFFFSFSCTKDYPPLKLMVEALSLKPIDPLAECAIATQWNFLYYNK